VETHRVRAHNSAPDSENRIHDDQTAASLGFRGGLVPGVTVYGYMTVPVVRGFGTEWLARGGMRVRFLQPAYEDDELAVELSGNAVRVLREEAACAIGEVFWVETPPPDLADYPERPLPDERPAASAESLAPGTILGTVYTDLSPAEPVDPLTLSNHLLMRNVKLGPWIHTASEIRNFSLAHDGDHVAVRGRVAERFERKGHQFVVLDVVVVGKGGRVIQQVRHTAIYQLRKRWDR